MTESPFGAGSEPIFVAIDPASKFAYVTNLGSDNVSAYAINATNGELVVVAGSPFGAGTQPSGVATCRVTAGACKPPPL